MMKPREIFKTKQSEINVNGEWHTIGSLSLIGSRNWTVRDADGNVIVRCSGNAEFEVR
jgi:hypothetical protein